MNWLFAAAVFVVCALASGAATGIVRRFLLAGEILDHPNERSSHDDPTPRGGGLAVTGVLTGAWIAIGTFGGGDITEILVLSLAAMILAGVSWLDDLHSLSARTRLAVQAICVAAALLATPMPAIEGLSAWMAPALIAVALAWIWFINLFNFMDGIDGISGVETGSVGLGAAAGFLWWNWSPSRIFLGDVGSIPIGFLLGWLLLKMALAGLWAPALILALYYLADATITLIRRLARGEKPWQAHKEHFYQVAVRSGRSHAHVSTWILSVNFLLILLAAAAVTYPTSALGAAAMLVAALLWRFSQAENEAPGPGTRSGGGAA